jgi:hypothetical protein
MSGHFCSLEVNWVSAVSTHFSGHRSNEENVFNVEKRK